MKTRVCLKYFFHDCLPVVFVPPPFGVAAPTLTRITPCLFHLIAVAPLSVWIKPLPDNIFPYTLAPEVPNSIPKKPPLCSFVSFFNCLSKASYQQTGVFERLNYFHVFYFFI